MTEDNKEEMQKLAQFAFEFMPEIDFKDDGKTRMVEFNFQRPIQGSPTPQDVTVQAPFIGLIPLPNLLINDIEVDFEQNVTSCETSTENEDNE